MLCLWCIYTYGPGFKWIIGVVKLYTELSRFGSHNQSIIQYILKASKLTTSSVYIYTVVYSNFSLSSAHKALLSCRKVYMHIQLTENLQRCKNNNYVFMVYCF